MTRGYAPTDREPTDTSCPTPESRIEEILGRTDRVPKMFPTDKFQAARFWMAHQEQPEDRDDDAAVPITVNGKIVGWRTPYHDRLCVRLRTFLRLKSIQQVHIIENIDNGVPWRGDSIEFYLQVIKESEIMKKNPKEYIGKGWKLWRRAARGMEA